MAPHVQVRFGGDTTKARSVYERMEPITAEDMAEAIHWVATLPAHVNVNTMEARMRVSCLSIIVGVQH